MAAARLLAAADARHALPVDLAVYPTGQSYAWGNPPSRSNGFAPAIGYDGHPGGNGY